MFRSDSKKKAILAMERIPVVKYIVEESIRNDAFDSEYILGERIVEGQKPACFPFPELQPMPTGPSEKYGMERER